MNARNKLNLAHWNGAILIAGVAGLATQSWLVFGFALAAIVFEDICTGGIRLLRLK